MKTERLYVDAGSGAVTPDVQAKAAAKQATPVVGLTARLLDEEYGIGTSFTITETDDEAPVGRNITRTIDRIP